MSKEDKKKNGISWWWPITFGVLILVSVIGSYYWFFNDHDVGGPTEWGTFGDFVGGVSNPLLGFLTIILLVASLRLQAQELKDSTEAVRQSAEELSLTRKIHKNQETLQLREYIRPQVAEELERRFKRCHDLQRANILLGVSLQAIINKEGRVSDVWDSIKMKQGDDEAKLKKSYEQKIKEYRIAVSSVVDCLCSMIDLLDSDIVIHPLIPRAERLIENLVKTGEITYQEASNNYYDPIDRAITQRKDKDKFPPLHKTGIDLTEGIEAHRNEHKTGQ